MFNPGDKVKYLGGSEWDPACARGETGIVEKYGPVDGVIEVQVRLDHDDLVQWFEPEVLLMVTSAAETA